MLAFERHEPRERPERPAERRAGAGDGGAETERAASRQRQEAAAASRARRDGSTDIWQPFRAERSGSGCHRRYRATRRPPRSRRASPAPPRTHWPCRGAWDRRPARRTPAASWRTAGSCAWSKVSTRNTLRAKTNRLARRAVTPTIRTREWQIARDRERQRADRRRRRIHDRRRRRRGSPAGAGVGDRGHREPSTGRAHRGARGPSPYGVRGDRRGQPRRRATAAPCRRRTDRRAELRLGSQPRGRLRRWRQGTGGGPVPQRPAVSLPAPGPRLLRGAPSVPGPALQPSRDLVPRRPRAPRRRRRAAGRAVPGLVPDRPRPTPGGGLRRDPGVRDRIRRCCTSARNACWPWPPTTAPASWSSAPGDAGCSATTRGEVAEAFHAHLTRTGRSVGVRAGAFAVWDRTPDSANRAAFAARFAAALPD